jgi:hypothetical protein
VINADRLPRNLAHKFAPPASRQGSCSNVAISSGTKQYMTIAFSGPADYRQ